MENVHCPRHHHLLFVAQSLQQEVATLSVPLVTNMLDMHHSYAAGLFVQCLESHQWLSIGVTARTIAVSKNFQTRYTCSFQAVCV